MGSVRQADGISRGAVGRGGRDPLAMPEMHQEHKGKGQDSSIEEQGQHEPPKNRMAEAIERGGIWGWGSYLTFAWAGPFLKLGSTVTLKEEHLEGIYKTHERCGFCTSRTLLLRKCGLLPSQQQSCGQT